MLGRTSCYCLSAWLVMLLLGGHASQAQTPSGEIAGAIFGKERSKVEGRTFNSVSGEPLRRVTLSLSPIDHTGTPRAAVSDSEGHFVFEGVDAGAYRLVAERAGFLRREYGAKKTESPGTPVVVTEANSATGLDLRLNPQGVIIGKVVDEEGEAVPHVDVTAFRRAGFGRAQRLAKVDAVATNDVGDFRIAGLDPGVYFVAANGRDAAPVAESNPQRLQPEEVYVASFYPGAADAVGASPVRIDAGQEAFGIDIRLQKARVYRVRGRIAGNLPGVPVKGTEMRLLPRQGADATMDVAPLIAFSSGDGAFEFRGVQSGSYQLTAVSTQGGARVLGRLPVEVTTAHVEGLRFEPSQGLLLTGSVHFESCSGPPLQGAAVILRAAASGLNLALSASISELGQFRLEGISSDEYRLDFLRLPEDCYIRSIQLNGQNAMGSALDLSQAQSMAKVEIALSGRAGTVEGKVRAEGQPAMANVFLEPESERAHPPFHSKQVLTGPDGQFRIRGVAPGRYLLFALPDEATFPSGLDPDLVESLRKSGARIEIEEGGHGSVELDLLHPNDSGR